MDFHPAIMGAGICGLAHALAAAPYPFAPTEVDDLILDEFPFEEA